MTTSTPPSQRGPSVPPDSTDHDLLLTIAGDMKSLAREMGEIKTSVKDDVTEIKTMVKEGQKDHETRIRTLEKRVWSIPAAPTVIAGAALLLSVYNSMKKG